MPNNIWWDGFFWSSVIWMCVIIVASVVFSIAKELYEKHEEKK